MSRYTDAIADALFEHLPMKRTNPRHPTIMDAARKIEAAVAAAMRNTK